MQEQPFTAQIRNVANVTLDVILAGIQANLSAAYQEANTSANSVAVFTNNSLVLANAFLNFNNTATINVSATANGTFESNVAFSTNTAAIQSLITPAFNQANAGVSAAATALAVAEAAFNTANVGISVSGITPGTYGSPSLALQITVDARGRVLSIGQATPTLFSPSGPGIVPASGGGSTNFLRADGAWAAPLASLAASLSPANGSMTFATTAGNILLQWGQRAIVAGGSSGPFTFTLNQAFASAGYIVIPTMVGGQISCAVASKTASQFSIFTSFASTNSTAMAFIAIGPA